MRSRRSTGRRRTRTTTRCSARWTMRPHATASSPSCGGRSGFATAKRRRSPPRQTSPTTSRFRCRRPWRRRRASKPTFADVADDQRWTHTGALLSCAPSETPDPLTVSTRWVPGVYRVAIDLHVGLLRQGYRDEFTVALGHDGDPPQRVRGVDADATGWV